LFIFDNELGAVSTIRYLNIYGTITQHSVSTA